MELNKAFDALNWDAQAHQKDGCDKNDYVLVSWTSKLSKLVRQGQPEEAICLFKRMLLLMSNQRTNYVTILSLIKAFDALNWDAPVMMVHVMVDVVLWSAMVAACVKNKDYQSLETGIHVFDGMLKKDLVSWRIVIRGYIENERCIEASNVFSKMRLLSFFAPDEFVVQDMIMALLQSGGSSARSVFDQIGCKDFIASNAMISAYTQCMLPLNAVDTFTQILDRFLLQIRKGQAGTALFDEVPFKDLICWSSMINGYVLNGYGVEALDTFSNIRQGNIEQALDFVKKMPMEPDKRIWGALLAGCRLTPGKIEIVELVVEQLATLDPQNCTHCYMILSDLYADEGRREDVEMMRRLVDENA
ncbi:hypothetical protein F3Y22_tig00116984pilonHSYRG00270 [Hibiscus syriacus]|uniref:Pentatricopeptide repeat-containing protein n=1 Tax=Hibiscus syriacus TaxID=106335 RepID=A0A6A2XMQ7_HIBSY|nr:hypothetical protein F3Y22_tig00116984pilonHSYRG00270 [Hibiscus syriacus]